MSWVAIRRWGTIAVTAVLALALVIGSTVATVTRSSAGPLALVIAALLAFTLIALSLRVELGRALRHLEGLGAALPVFAFSLVTLLVGSSPATPTFNEIGAQVIVVLLLALAIDARFFRLQAGRDRLEVAAVAFTMLVLAVGEYYALAGLLVEGPGHPEMIAGAIAAGFTAVAVTAMVGGGPERQEPER